MHRVSAPTSLGIATLIAALLIGFAGDPAAIVAQVSKTKPAVKAKPVSPGEAKALEGRAEKLQESFLRDTQELARDLEQAGLAQRAKTLYEALLKLDPKLPGVKEKVDELNDAALSSNEFEVELDTSRGWSSPVAVVQKDLQFRVRADGDYKFTAEGRVTAEGFPHDDVANDLVANLPVGALIGVYVTDKKPGKPFLIGAKKDLNPQQNSLLLLKINAPAGHKSTGKIKVRISGNASKP